jgi:hypothetical protein
MDWGRKGHAKRSDELFHWPVTPCDQNAWTAHLKKLGFTDLKVNPDPVEIATEGALWGSIKAHGLLPNTVIVSDDAGQFNVGEHGLCWVHAERLVHKLDAFTDANRKAQRHIRDLILRFYRDLKAYRLAPSEKRKASLMARFDRIFTRQTGFVTLDRLLKRLHANKAELLKVLERPEIPLHTNGSEDDIRSHVTKRKVSGGTRSDIGRDCRDGFLGLAKTCKKLAVLSGSSLVSTFCVLTPYYHDQLRRRSLCARLLREAVNCTIALALSESPAKRCGGTSLWRQQAFRRRALCRFGSRRSQASRAMLHRRRHGRKWYRDGPSLVRSRSR